MGGKPGRRTGCSSSQKLQESLALIAGRWNMRVTKSKFVGMKMKCGILRAFAASQAAVAKRSAMKATRRVEDSRGRRRERR
ncbi:hypothetical protein IEQ34_003193 [Dendrobium chrysotoxum]|uniref:Uncharacterized protein n=1 Tax=Dendrobium chrysotoxum TaxID=161865 RepID=A0AAV7HJ34_DENCH|nr:hypothetical protein IEQ34_003193 [Dendrobium chrysotoxum]